MEGWVDEMGKGGLFLRIEGVEHNSYVWLLLYSVERKRLMGD